MAPWDITLPLVKTPANPVQGSVGPEPVEPEAKAKDFEEKLERGKVETVVEGEGALVEVKWEMKKIC